MLIESIGTKRIGHCIAQIMVESTGPSFDLSAQLFTTAYRSETWFNIQIDGTTTNHLRGRLVTNVDAGCKKIPVNKIQVLICFQFNLIQTQENYLIFRTGFLTGGSK